jgi:Protein of unknown function (DUF3575)
MKKILLTLITIIAVNAAVSAQVIKVAPVSLAFGVINAGYEMQLGEKSSLYPSAYYYTRSSVSGFGLGLQYRKYLSASKDFPAGFFVAPEVQYGSFKQKDFGDYSYSAFSLGAQIGYQWLVGDSFTIEASVGPTYWIAGGTTTGTITYDGVLPSIGLNLGYFLGGK